MDAIENIINRRSIRKYKNKPVSSEKLMEIIKAGMYAPSAMGKFPWEFIVITDRKILDKIPEYHPHAKMLHQVPAAILVCGDKEKAHSDEYLIIDLAAAVQNMLLAAHATGLGSCWLGIYPREERMEGMYKIFDIPENIQPHSLIAIGYADENKELPDRVDKSMIHYDKW